MEQANKDRRKDGGTVVEPASGLTPDEAANASQPLPRVETVDKATRREKVRTVVAYSVIGVTLLLGCALAGAYLEQAGNVKSAIAGVFTPLLGVAGVIVGFYFGGKDSTN